MKLLSRNFRFFYKQVVLKFTYIKLQLVFYYKIKQNSTKIVQKETYVVFLILKR